MKIKLITSLILLCTFTSIAQTEKELELRQEFWTKSGKEIAATSFKEEWKNESAVILKDHRYIRYINNGKNVLYKSNKHELIKIQDQSSLEELSEISLDKDSKISFGWVTASKEEITLGIRIIKPDGSVSIVDVAKEEVVEDDVRKIAIPNLEIGDIIDIFIQTDRKEKEYDGLEKYPAFETTLSDSYPIVDYRIAVEVENDFFLNMNTYNGAPAVKEEPTDRNATSKYVVEAQNLEKIETSRWYYPLVEQPAIKIQVAFARKASNEYAVNIFKGEDGERKSTVTKADVLEYYDRKFSKVDKKWAKSVLDYVNKTKYNSKSEKLQAALEYIRFDRYNRFIEAILAYQADIVSGTPRSKCYNYYYGIYESDQQVIADLRSIAEQLNIDYDIILAQPRYDGALDDMLIKDNARIGIQFNTSPKLYFFDFNENMTLERYPAILEGAEAYSGSVIKRKRIESLKKVNLIPSTATDNVHQENISLSILDDKKGLELKRDIILNGHFEDRNIFRLMHWTDFLADDYKHFDYQDHFYECGNKKELIRYKEQFKALEQKKIEEFNKNREEGIEREWSDATVDNFTASIIETGRFGTKSPLIVKESFTLKDGYIKKAGKNIILEIGKFISSQVTIEDDERERTSNIYLDHAKTYQYNIELVIPSGYVVKGVDALNMNVDNETGAFKTTAVVEGSTLKIATTKTYKKNYLKAEQWNDMLLWLDKANEFYESKILLERQ